MTGRDYLAEMNDAVDAALPDGEYVVPLVAHDLVEKLLANDPDLLRGWCEVRYRVILTDFIHHKVKNRRNTSRESAARSVFAAAASEFAETGDAEALRDAVQSPFDAEYVINREQLRRPVRDMTGADHLFVAADYAETKQTAALLESFHRAVAKKQVVEERLYLGVTEPSDVLQSFPENKRAGVRGIQYTEICRDVKTGFTVITDHEFGDRDWAMLWLTGEQQGIGASRSQGFGRYEVVRWERQ